MNDYLCCSKPPDWYWKRKGDLKLKLIKVWIHSANIPPPKVIGEILRAVMNPHPQPPSTLPPPPPPPQTPYTHEDYFAC